MGYDLMNAHSDYFRFHILDWPMVLALANLYGWKPAGTLEPFYRDPDSEEFIPNLPPWDSMNYTTNDFQWVTDEDATSIADALEIALHEHPADLDSQEMIQRIEARLSDNGAKHLEKHYVARWHEENVQLVTKIASLSARDGYETELCGSGITGLNAISLSSWCAKNREYIKSFIRFCRKGGFDIS